VVLEVLVLLQDQLDQDLQVLALQEDQKYYFRWDLLHLGYQQVRWVLYFLEVLVVLAHLMVMVQYYLLIL
jgi:hypothetical protein